MNHERALRSLALQHHLHLGATAPRASFDDGHDRRSETPRPATARRVFSLGTLFRRSR